MPSKRVAVLEIKVSNEPGCARKKNKQKNLRRAVGTVWFQLPKGGWSAVSPPSTWTAWHIYLAAACARSDLWSKFKRLSILHQIKTES